MKKRGVGIGSMYYAIGYGFNRPDHAAATIEIADDGTITLLTGCCDIGQGSDTILAQIAAEELGIDYEDVHIISADTAVTPDSGASTASRQTFVSGNAVRMAAIDLKEKLILHAREILGLNQGEVFIKDKIIHFPESSKNISIAAVAKSLHDKGKPFLGYGWYNNTTPDVDPETNQGDAYASYCFATQVVEVEVDTDTGQVEVLKVIAVHDVGKAINPVTCEGQIEGGVVQGLGYGLFEEVETKDGVVRTRNFDEFLMPTAADVPDITSIIVEDEEPKGPYGAKGVGEPSLIPTAPAIVNAIYDAIGVRIFQLPANLERVLAAAQPMGKKGGEGDA
ncbi:MAG: molybdopterin cofactor-binding domain-containing protein [Bacillota bacterium]